MITSWFDSCWFIVVQAKDLYNVKKYPFNFCSLLFLSMNNRENLILIIISTELAILIKVNTAIKSTAIELVRYILNRRISRSD